MSHCYVIAEAGVNHNGRIDLAERLIDAAVDAGADAVKFQSFRADKLVSPDARKAEYQLRYTDETESQLEMLRKLELSDRDHEHLRDRCLERRIEFLSTPFDEESADMLEALGVARFKVASGELTNAPLLQHLAGKEKPLIVSTGMATLEEVERAVAVIRAAGDPPVTILHCVSNYPAPVEEVNLRAMLTLGARTGHPVGYSDHTLGVEVSLAAVALGATVIEKHLTLDRQLPGPDHHASLEPAEFKEMVRLIRNIERALGDGRKAPTTSEESTRLVARKSLFARVPITRGAIIETSMLICKRPGDGISPLDIDRVVGLRAAIDVREGEKISWATLES
ncbi:MAG TPA: N-acetylneuraminate synthase [Thermoanaerobaculia bacterium]|nr:N-acetylneuraminate synthase [Thermoanaerobaculia bacterium]